MLLNRRIGWFYQYPVNKQELDWITVCKSWTAKFDLWSALCTWIRKWKRKRINASVCSKSRYRFSFLPADPIICLHYTYATGGKKVMSNSYFWSCFWSTCQILWLDGSCFMVKSQHPELTLEFSPLGKRMWIQMKYNRFYVPEPEECLILTRWR